MLNELENKAQSYLQHMLLAAQVEDKSKGLWRNLFDNWFAYSQGHPFVASGGKGQPQWFNKASPIKQREILLAMHSRSVLADTIIRNREDIALAVDHAVPISLMRDMIIEQASGWQYIDQVRYFLETWYRLCVITPEEHSRLNSKAFHTARPGAHDLYKRYEHAKIPIIEL